MSIALLFSEYFEIDATVLEHYGAMNICIDSDLPLFMDPFLLFASEKPEYVQLHKEIVGHLVRLRELATENPNIDSTLFQFPEIKQNWLGFCKWGNNGKGLGPTFARNLIRAFNGFYSNFGEETVTSSSHIEKLTLVGAGIGRDFISDFTVNLMLEYLLRYSEAFALKHLREDQRKQFSIRCAFNSGLLVWTPKTFTLPYFYRDDGDFIVLTPIDILTKDEAFICHNDLQNQFRKITTALPNEALREGVNRYYRTRLPVRPNRSETERAVTATLQKYPEILDYYIRYKENTRHKAKYISAEKVEKLRRELVTTLSDFSTLVALRSGFFKIAPDTYSAALQRVHYLKDVIENNDGYRIFYKKGKPIASEDTVQRIFRLTWFATDFDVNAEVNNGRGPADYKVSYGRRDATIVEFKLGSSTSLRRNLLNQVEIYKRASKAITDIKVILCYTKAEIAKVRRILKSIKQEGAENVVVIDATKRPSASKA